MSKKCQMVIYISPPFFFAAYRNPGMPKSFKAFHADLLTAGCKCSDGKVAH